MMSSNKMGYTIRDCNTRKRREAQTEERRGPEETPLIQRIPYSFIMFLYYISNGCTNYTGKT